MEFAHFWNTSESDLYHLMADFTVLQRGERRGAIPNYG